MTPTGIHLLLTLRCIEECDHCFLWSSPESTSVMPLSLARLILNQSKRVCTVNHIYLDGGEPFLYYPIMLETLRMARSMDLECGIVTNCYWATNYEDAYVWLKPLAEIGTKDLSLSADVYHGVDLTSSRVRDAAQAANDLGIPAQILAIKSEGERVESIEGVKVSYQKLMYKGRAAEKLAKDALKSPWEDFDECPYENLESPERVHIDPMGHIQVCQGLCIGNILDRTLSEVISEYDYKEHRFLRPLVEGGPAALARELGFIPAPQYADACHLCYHIRSCMRDASPKELCPKEVYGVYE